MNEKNLKTAFGRAGILYEVFNMTNCPVCSNKRAIGKVGSEQYYCWDCCVEFIVRGEETTVYSVQPDGTLTLYFDPVENVI